MRWPGRFLHIVPSPFRPAIAAMRTAPCTGPPMVIPVRRPLPAASNPDITGTSPIPDSRNPDKTDTRRHWNGLIQRGGRCHIHINLSNRTCNTARRINHTAPNQSQRQHGCSATSAQQGGELVARWEMTFSRMAAPFKKLPRHGIGTRYAAWVPLGL